MNTIDIAFSFDTTSSMRAVLASVRRGLREIVSTLRRDVPKIRIALIAHGDSMNSSDYPIKIQKLTSDGDTLQSFIETCGDNAGGGPHANYELVLHEARALNWNADASRLLVMIGDEVPHHARFTYPGSYATYQPRSLYTGRNYDWKNELALLLQSKVRVHGVHCLPGVRPASREFYAALAQMSGGYYMTLDQLAGITDLVMAICYREGSPAQLERFEQELVRIPGRSSRSLTEAIDAMLNRKSAKRVKSDLEAIPAGRFQYLHVFSDQDIRSFVEAHDLKFNPGRGFYEFTKPETIQAGKEIVLLERSTNDMFTGPKARKLLGLPPAGTHSVKIKPTQLADYAVFVQSMSHNRKLKAGTRFLYEHANWMRRA
jgi:hypothetical protein